MFGEAVDFFEGLNELIFLVHDLLELLCILFLGL